MNTRLALSCAICALFSPSAQALAGGTTGVCDGCEEVVFDLSPFTPAGVAGEVIGAHTLQREVIDARLKVVFEVQETNPWSFDGAFSFNGRAFGFSSFNEGWTGTGTFEFDEHSPNLNGFIGTTSGQGLAAWFFNFSGGAFVETPGGSSVVPIDGHFSTLRLTLTLAPLPLCPGDCDGSRKVDFNDLVATLFEFGDDEAGGACDADGNGLVDFNDLVATLFLYGSCPGPLDA